MNETLFLQVLFLNLRIKLTFWQGLSILPTCFYTSLYRGVEQLVARRAHNPEVLGSSPSPATNK